MATSTWRHRFLILQRICYKAGYKILGRVNKSLQPKESFFIKPGYHHAQSAESFNAINIDEQYQRSVYELAATYASKITNASILDVGCGSGYKLVNMLGIYNTTGIEVEPHYSWLLKKYPDRKWMLYNPGLAIGVYADIIICADVIEHVKNPDELMTFLQQVRFSYLIISTPERDRIFGANDYGPPENTSHYREWNANEFRLYVDKWFAVIEQHVFDDKSITQVIVCVKK